MQIMDLITKGLASTLTGLGITQQPLETDDAPSLVPPTLAPDDGFSRDITNCPGYTLSDLKERSDGLTARLELAGSACNAYGNDIKSLTLEVDYESSSRLHVHIYDTAKEQYQIPENIIPRPASASSDRKPSLRFHHTSSPFAFWITRSSSGEIIFDTRPENIPVHKEPLTRYDQPWNDTSLPSYPLVFEDQYLQIATALPSNANIYGLGEVISSSGLRRDPNNTVATLWNSDSAGVPADTDLYGSHPFYVESREGQSHGVFLMNSHGMDVVLRERVLEYRALGGTIDLYFLAGPTPKEVIQQYGQVIGFPAKMPSWAFGFHLCRWAGEWVDLDRMKAVVEKMREEGIPMDTMWNDLDYMDRYRDFETNKHFNQKDFIAFTDWLHANYQHYIPIVDAAIGVPKKNDPYEAYDRGHELDVFIKDQHDKEFVGQVWPGPTVFPDWTARNTQEWWQANFDSFRGKSGYDGIWLDMNEPASGVIITEMWGNDSAKSTPDDKVWEVVDGERKRNLWGYPPYALHDGWKSLGSHTVAASAKLADGTRHYNSHNLFGFLENIATRKVLLEQEPSKRPFILSRSTFAGQGAVSAHWLGDNYSTWKSMIESIQGVLQFQMYQLPMVGADVCGFSKNATEELCNRWMMLGSFYPFYRNHNVEDASDQEPFRWKSVAAASIKAIDLRYRLLPYWESLFAQAHNSGVPPVRPLFFEFDDPALLSADRQMMLGDAILVTPVLEEGATSVRGHFPAAGAPWRDWWTKEVLETDQDGMATVEAPLGHIPVHIRAGSAFLTYSESRYTITETRRGGYTLIVNLDLGGQATGQIVLDDGISTEDLDAETTLLFSVKDGAMKLSSSGHFVPENTLEEIIVMGISETPAVSLDDDLWTWNANIGVLSISGQYISLAPGQDTTICSW